MKTITAIDITRIILKSFNWGSAEKVAAEADFKRFGTTEYNGSVDVTYVLEDTIGTLHLNKTYASSVDKGFATIDGPLFQALGDMLGTDGELLFTAKVVYEVRRLSTLKFSVVVSVRQVNIIEPDVDFAPHEELVR